MNKLISTLLLAIASLLFIVPGHAEIYKWTDGDGVVHFGEKPPSSGKSEIVDITVTRPSTPNPSSRKIEVEVAPDEVKRGGKNKKVVMYGTSWCTYCKKARGFFREEGIRFVEYDVEKLPRRMREFKRLGGTGYPLILIGKDDQMRGFSVSGFERRYNR